MITHSIECIIPENDMSGDLYIDTVYMPAVIVPENEATSAFPDELNKRLDEINETWRIIRDPVSDTAFEVAEVNIGQTKDGVLDNSTYSSSLSGNPGNAFELAYRGMTTPSERRIYVATMGNGGSDNFSNKELSYLRKTGRLTVDDGSKSTALPTIQSLRRALEHEGWQPTKMSADSFGSSIATALMSEFDYEQISHAFFKGRPNISNQNPLLLAKHMLVTESMVNARSNAKTSKDPWSMVDWIAAETRKKLPHVYDTKVEHEGNIVRQLSSYLLGLSIGASDGASFTSPAFVDTRSAYERQGTACITFDFPERDLLYKNPGDYLNFIGALGTIAGSQTLGLVTPGTHGGHAYNPNLRATVERHAFSRTI